MTNLFLTITLATNIGITKISVSGTESNHLYSMQTTDCITNAYTNWCKGWIFNGYTTNFYDYTDTNKFYRVQDLGVAF